MLLTSDLCFIPLDKSSGCWLHTLPKVGAAVQSFDILYSSKQRGLKVSLSSLAVKLQAGELLWLSNFGIFELRILSFHTVFPSPDLTKSRSTGLCCGELGGELVLLLNLLDTGGKIGDDVTDGPILGISLDGVIFLLSCV